MTCAACSSDPHPANSDPRRCAFDDAGLFVLEWYKRHDRTPVATVVSDDGIALLTLGCAEALVEFYRDGVVP